jgi:chemotaxis response regulator CheB
MEEASMAAPIVFISRWRIRQGKRAALEAMSAGAVAAIGSTKPRTALFAAYLDEAGEELRIVHAVPDAAALSDHFEGSQERSASVQDMIELLGFEVCGAAPEAAVDQLRRETAAVPGAVLTLLPISIGGYLRAPV